MRRIIRSPGELHPVDLPLLGGEASLGVSGEGLCGLRVAGVLEVVVADGELCVGLFDVGAVDDADVAAAEDGPLVGVAGDGELREVEVEALPQVQREDEGGHRLVRRPVLLARVPGQGRVPADGAAVLRLDQGQRFGDVVALLVELSGGEVVFAGPVEQAEALDFVLGEEGVDVLVVGGDPAVEAGNAAGDGDRGGDGLQFLLLLVEQVELPDAVERALELLEHLLALLHVEVGLEPSVLIHEERGEDLVHVDAGDVVVVVFVDHVDEVDGVCVEAEVADPLLEGVVLLLDLADEAGEEALHLLLHHEHLGDLGVGVLADDALQLAPLHLLALVVEQRALALRAQPVLADEGRLAALRVYADLEALVAVDALRAALQRLAHAIKCKLIIAEGIK